MNIVYEGGKGLPEAMKMGVYVFKMGQPTPVPDDIGRQIMAKPIAKERKFKVIPAKEAEKATAKAAGKKGE